MAKLAISGGNMAKYILAVVLPVRLPNRARQLTQVATREKENKMSEYNTTNLERTNLEAHVDLCAERYKQLDTRLTTIETKVSGIAKTIQDSKDGLSQVIITAAGTIVTGLLGLILTIITKF
jgi:hypothetical protein